MGTLEYTDEAMRNIENMQRRVWDLENYYGAKSDEALKATWSFLHSLRTLFQWGGKVFAEDQLSLILNGPITIGVIWHPKRVLTDGNWETDPLIGEWSCHS